MTAEPFVPDDPALPGLASLFAADGPPAVVIEQAQRHASHPIRAEDAVLSYARYWPGRRAVAQWTFEDEGSPVVVSAEINRRDGGSSGSSTRVEVFPDDRVLSALSSVTSREWTASRLAPLLGLDHETDIRARPLSYKSWRRCVIEYSFEQDGRPRRVYAKLFRDDRGEALFRRLQDVEASLAAAGSVWRVPRTLAYLPDARMLLQDELPARESLSELARRAPGDEAATSQLLEAVRRAAQGLSALQSLALLEPETRTPASIIESLQEDIESMALASPRAARSLRHVLHLISSAAERLDPEPLVASHGAFRHSHVYPLDDGGLGLLDLDNLGLAPASADAGYFLAYLRYAALNRPRLRSTLDACVQAFTAELPEVGRYTRRWRLFHLRTVLLKWALRSFFSLERDWQETLEGVVELCNSVGRERILSIDDPYLQRGASRSLLASIARDRVAPHFWPRAERVDLHGTETTFEPDRECVVDATLLIASDSPMPESKRVVFTFAAEPELESARAKVASLAGSRSLYLPDEACLVELFPTDYRLPALARALTPAYLAQLLQGAGFDIDPSGLSAEVMRYRPHERCVIGFRSASDGGQRYVLKVYDDRETAEEVWTTLRALRGQLVRPNLVVEPLAVDPEACVVAMEFVQGFNLGHAMDATTDETEMRALTAEAASTLAALHALYLEHDRVKTYHAEAAKLRRHADNMRRVAPQLAESVHRTLDLIDARARLTREPRPSFVHGGFKPTQLLRRADGVTVVDFDGSCLGDPAMDVGRFMAKLKADSLDPARAHLANLDEYFLQRYVAESSPGVLPRVRIYQALALVRMATRRFQTSYVATLRRRRESVSDGLLRLASQALE